MLRQRRAVRSKHSILALCCPDVEAAIKFRSRNGWWTDLRCGWIRWQQLFQHGRNVRCQAQTLDAARPNERSSVQLWGHRVGWQAIRMRWTQWHNRFDLVRSLRPPNEHVGVFACHAFEKIFRRSFYSQPTNLCCGWFQWHHQSRQRRSV